MESKPEEEVKEFTDQQNQVLDPNEIPVIARQRANVSSEAQRLPEQIKRPGAFNFNPTKDSPHHTGQKMPFWYICNALLDIEKCEGKNSQTLIKEIIANVFRAAIVNNAEELVELFYFFVIRLAPEYEALETGVGHELVLKSVAKACGKTPKQIREQFQKEGDLGLVVASGKKTISTIGTFFKGQTTTKKPSLTFATVF